MKKRKMCWAQLPQSRQEGQKMMTDNGLFNKNKLFIYELEIKREETRHSPFPRRLKKKLHIIHRDGIRIFTGTFRTFIAHRIKNLPLEPRKIELGPKMGQRR